MTKLTQQSSSSVHPSLQTSLPATTLWPNTWSLELTTPSEPPLWLRAFHRTICTNIREPLSLYIGLLPEGDTYIGCSTTPCTNILEHVADGFTKWKYTSQNERIMCASISPDLYRTLILSHQWHKPQLNHRAPEVVTFKELHQHANWQNRSHANSKLVCPSPFFQILKCISSSQILCQINQIKCNERQENPLH